MEPQPRLIETGVASLTLVERHQFTTAEDLASCQLARGNLF